MTISALWAEISFLSAFLMLAIFVNPCCASSSSSPLSSVHFAIVVDPAQCDIPQDQWIGTGSAFDLEKRLGRWGCMQSADRLKIRRVMRIAKGEKEPFNMPVLWEQMGVDVVIKMSIRCSKGEIAVGYSLWTDGAKEKQSLVLKDKMSNLFELHDRLIDQLIASLQKVFPKLPAPENILRLHLRPALSVVAYGEMICGMIASQSGDSKTAAVRLQKALEEDPKLWWGHYFLGSVYFHEGQFDKAAECCRNAIAIDPDLYAGVYANLSYCYTGVGDAEKALWAKSEFERRTGKPLPGSGLPAAN